MAAFLISSFSGKNQQNLSAAVLMPIGSGSGFKRNVAYRGVEELIVGVEHGEVGLTGEEFSVGIDFSLFKDGIYRCFFIS